MHERERDRVGQRWDGNDDRAQAQDRNNFHRPRATRRETEAAEPGTAASCVASVSSSEKCACTHGSAQAARALEAEGWRPRWHLATDTTTAQDAKNMSSSHAYVVFEGIRD